MIKKHIIKIMENWDNQEIWRRYAGLQKEIFDKFNIKYTIEELKKTMKELKNDGIVEKSCTHNGEGMFSGSGYFLR